MLTKLLVVQKIEDDGNVNIYQFFSENFQWAFVVDKKNENDENEEYFPFVVMGDLKA